MSKPNVIQDNSFSCSQQIDGLLPAFPSRTYSQLPTPQSPNTLGRYLDDRPACPETPVPHSNISISYIPSTPPERFAHSERKQPTASLPSSHQYATPESSPQFQHPSSTLNILMTPRNLFDHPTPNFATPQQTPIKVESPAPRPAISSYPRARSPLSSSPARAPSMPSSTLSSPFMGRISVNDHGHRPEDDNPFLPRPSKSIVPSNCSPSPSNQPRLPAGGEMERIRQARLEERMTHLQEAEKRRPDYLKRAQRSLDEPDSVYLDDMTFDDDSWPAVGVTDSPQKGRRLKLFQETSEESFEESLMAGGYGRYRTAEWTRQPQPFSLVPNAAGSNASVASSGTPEAPPSVRELKKRKRLTAFTAEPHFTQLHPTTVEGKGRVVFDPLIFGQSSNPEPSPSKRRATPRRKKKLAAADKKTASLSGSEDDQTSKPNWPDTEFPWKVRVEERVDEAKAQEDERLKWIERYLDRDSDDEDDEILFLSPNHAESSSTRPYYKRISHTRPVRKGRGKSIPLTVNRNNQRELIPRSFFPVDSADAIDALLSKKSVRTLSYRHQKRLGEEDEFDADLCICHGKDDGRELVQCDLCHTWYHLLCIDIKNISELGREEDPWFCKDCRDDNISWAVSIEAEESPASEPTFVPTEPAYHGQLYSQDVSLPASTFMSPTTWSFPTSQPLRVPKTPTRGSRNIYSESSRMVESLRHAPTQSLHRSFNSLGASDSVGHLLPAFDPPSTPWNYQNFNPFIQTPLQVGDQKSSNSARILHPGSSASMEDMSPHTYITLSDGMMNHRRNASSPPHLPTNMYEDSPVVRAGSSRIQNHRF